jgi:hypothetical protein
LNLVNFAGGILGNDKQRAESVLRFSRNPHN